MWSIPFERIAERTIGYAVERDGRRASFDEVMLAWREDPYFRSLFNSTLADSQFESFRWETPAVTRLTASRPFEFVLVDSPGLAQTPDPAAFAKYFTNAESTIAVFPNLGGDAIMVVPCPISEPSHYGHLAAFVRRAPESQRHALWQSVGVAMEKRVDKKPVWLSTAGAGVSWLHVRLDDWPKYYHFLQYREAASWPTIQESQ